VLIREGERANAKTEGKRLKYVFAQRLRRREVQKVLERVSRRFDAEFWRRQPR